MDTLTVTLTPAPSTPLNLRFGVIYAPRVKTPPFAGFEAIESAPRQWVIRAYDQSGGTTVEVHHGNDLLEVYRRLAQHLRMDQ